MKYEIGQLVRIKDDALEPVMYYIGIIIGCMIPDYYDILCVGDRHPDVFFESEIIEVLT